jgi:hypothetical protein
MGLYVACRTMHTYACTFIIHHFYIIFEDNKVKRTQLTILRQVNGVLVQCQIYQLFKSTENIKTEIMGLRAFKGFC